MASTFINHLSTTSPAARPRPTTKMARAKRALYSLAIAVTIPLSLIITSTLLFAHNGAWHGTRLAAKPLPFPPHWLFHAASLLSAILMGLASFLVWADGGFHGDNNALPLYVAQVALSPTWMPLVLVVGAHWAGLILCLLDFGVLFACRRAFRSVNPIAGDLVRLCKWWVGYLAIVNVKLIFFRSA